MSLTINNKYNFIFYSLLSGKSKLLKAGEYYFSKNSTNKVVLTKLYKNEVKLYKFLIPECYSNKQVYFELLKYFPLLEGFEKSLFGMVAGEKSSCVIAAEFAFGVGNPDNIQRFRRHEIESMLEGGDATLEPGLVLSFADAAKGELAGVVDSVETEAVFVNFNHPLADKDITFDVHIVEVVPA